MQNASQDAVRQYRWRNKLSSKTGLPVKCKNELKKHPLAFNGNNNSQYLALTFLGKIVSSVIRDTLFSNPGALDKCDDHIIKTRFILILIPPTIDCGLSLLLSTLRSTNPWDDPFPQPLTRAH